MQIQNELKQYTLFGTLPDSVYYQDVITGFYKKKTITRTWKLKDAKGYTISYPQTILLNPPCTGF